MDPAELIDSRPNDGPLALWRNKIVLGVHQDAHGVENRDRPPCSRHSFSFGWNPTMMATGAEYWLRQIWIQATAVRG